MNIPDSMATALMSLIAAGAGAYFGAYFKKKGENLATREDIAQITTKQKEIEALISDRFWDRQKQWEMKRDALVRAIQAAEDCSVAILHFAAYREAQKLQVGASDDFSKRIKELGQAMSVAVSAFDSADILVKLLCEAKTVDAFATLAGHLRQAATQTHQPEFTELKSETAEHLQSLMDAAVAAAREELGVPNRT